MSHLYEVVELHAAAYDRGVGLGAVDAGVGADLDIILDDDIAHLRDLVEAALGVGQEAEAVGADDGTRMYDAAAPDTAALVYLHSGVEGRRVAYLDIVADVCLGIYCTSVADDGARLYDGEVTDVAILADGCFGRDRRAGRYALLAGLGGVVYLEQVQYGHVYVGNLYECCGDGSLRLEVVADQHYRGAGSIYKGFVFRIGEVCERALVSPLYRRDGVYGGLGVALDTASDEARYHLCGKFHDGRISVVRLSVCLSAARIMKVCAYAVASSGKYNH